jgi:hypothetical protein
MALQHSCPVFMLLYHTYLNLKLSSGKLSYMSGFLRNNVSFGAKGLGGGGGSEEACLIFNSLIIFGWKK